MCVEGKDAEGSRRTSETRGGKKREEKGREEADGASYGSRAFTFILNLLSHGNLVSLGID